MNTSMKNKVQLIGNLGKDPELKNVGNGQALLRLSLATNERYKTPEGDWKDNTQWHPIVVWGKQAEKMATQVRKGTGDRGPFGPAHLRIQGGRASIQHGSGAERVSTIR